MHWKINNWQLQVIECLAGCVCSALELVRACEGEGLVGSTVIRNWDELLLPVQLLFFGVKAANGNFPKCPKAIGLRFYYNLFQANRDKQFQAIFAFFQQIYLFKYKIKHNWKCVHVCLCTRVYFHPLWVGVDISQHNLTFHLGLYLNRNRKKTKTNRCCGNCLWCVTGNRTFTLGIQTILDASQKQTVAWTPSAEEPENPVYLHGDVTFLWNKTIPRYALGTKVWTVYIQLNEKAQPS